MRRRQEPIPGRTWEVRPTLLIPESRVDPTDPTNVARGLRIQERLASNGVWAPGFSVVYRGGAALAIEATLVLEAPTPGQAVDTALTRLHEALDAEGGTTKGLQECVVLPGWVDERDWQTARWASPTT